VKLFSRNAVALNSRRTTRPACALPVRCCHYAFSLPVLRGYSRVHIGCCGFCHITCRAVWFAAAWFASTGHCSAAALPTAYLLMRTGRRRTFWALVRTAFRLPGITLLLLLCLPGAPLFVCFAGCGRFARARLYACVKHRLSPNTFCKTHSFRTTAPGLRTRSGVRHVVAGPTRTCGHLACAPSLQPCGRDGLAGWYRERRMPLVCRQLPMFLVVSACGLRLLRCSSSFRSALIFVFSSVSFNCTAGRRVPSRGTPPLPSVGFAALWQQTTACGFVYRPPGQVLNMPGRPGDLLAAGLNVPRCPTNLCVNVDKRGFGADVRLPAHHGEPGLDAPPFLPADC